MAGADASHVLKRKIMVQEHSTSPGITVWDSQDNEINLLIDWTENTQSEDIGYDDVQILERTTVFTINKIVFQNRSEREIRKRDVSLEELTDIICSALDTYNIEDSVEEYYQTLLD